LSATPIQLAVAYSALANGGLVVTPHVVKAILVPGTPDGDSGFIDIAQMVVEKDFTQGRIQREIDMTKENRDPIVNGLRRVIEGKGVDFGYYHKATGELLFKNYARKTLPIAGKTGTAQGFGNYPWNDSSAFAAFSLDPNQPYTAVAYLEKSGYGSQAAAPVVKCLFSALAGQTKPSAVVPSDPIDLNATAVSPIQFLANPLCLSGFGGSVRD
jgi:penicillin-binding protein 2